MANELEMSEQKRLMGLVAQQWERVGPVWRLVAKEEYRFMYRVARLVEAEVIDPQTLPALGPVYAAAKASLMSKNATDAVGLWRHAWRVTSHNRANTKFIVRQFVHEHYAHSGYREAFGSK